MEAAILRSLNTVSRKPVQLVVTFSCETNSLVINMPVNRVYNSKCTVKQLLLCGDSVHPHH